MQNSKLIECGFEGHFFFTTKRAFFLLKMTIKQYISHYRWKKKKNDKTTSSLTKTQKKKASMINIKVGGVTKKQELVGRL